MMMILLHSMDAFTVAYPSLAYATRTGNGTYRPYLQIDQAGGSGAGGAVLATHGPINLNQWC
jgi:hypothetical protein